MCAFSRLLSSCATQLPAPPFTYSSWRLCHTRPNLLQIVILLPDDHFRVHPSHLRSDASFELCTATALARLALLLAPCWQWAAQRSSRRAVRPRHLHWGDFPVLLADQYGVEWRLQHSPSQERCC